MANERIVCNRCGRNQTETSYHEPNAKLYGGETKEYPQKRIPVCSDCVHQIYDFNTRDDILEYLRLLNRPFIKDQWEKAYSKDKNKTMNTYLKVINNLKQYSKLTFDDSDGHDIVTKKDMIDQLDKIQILDSRGKVIKVTPEVISRFGNEEDYTEQDYARMERYYINTRLDYDIKTSIQESLLVDLAKMYLKKEKLFAKGDISGADKVARLYSITMKDADFLPKNKKTTVEEMGISSFGEVIKRLEIEGGFIPPDRIDYDKDDIDKMLLYYMQGMQTFNDEPKWVDAPDNWRDDIIDESFEVDVEENIQDFKNNSETLNNDIDGDYFDGID